MKMIYPLSNNVLLEPLEKEQEVNGIIMPDTVKDTPGIGRVIAVGEGKTVTTNQHTKTGTALLPSKLKRGQEVVYKKWQAHEVKLEGKNFVLVNEDDILGIIA
jgi:chaperonin GroES